MKKITFCLLIGLLLLLTGCGLIDQISNHKKAKADFLAMDTYMTLTAYGKNSKAAVEAAQQRICQMDQILSTTNPESEIAKLNQQKKLSNLSEDTYRLIGDGIKANDFTNRYFSISMYPVSKLWGFTTGEYRVPKQAEITEKMQSVLLNQYTCKLDDEKSQVELLDKGLELDLGGIAKGYAADRVMEIFKENGCESAIVSLGNSIQTLGTKPDGSLWQVAIANPKDDKSYLGVVSVESKAVVTSGGYERFFEQDGEHYCHIINPFTGWPANSRIASVTVVADKGEDADILSTALFSMGESRAIDFWRQHQDSFGMILYLKNSKMYVTDNLSDAFESEKSYKIIHADSQEDVLHDNGPGIEESKADNDVLTIANLKVKKGDAAFISCNNVSGMIDCGRPSSYEKIEKFLKAQDCEKLDFLILSHFDKDHIGSAAQIIKNFSVEDLYIPDYEEDSEYFRELQASYDFVSNVHTISENTQVTYDNLSIDFFPAKDVAALENEPDDFDNNMSLICKLSFGEKSFLFTGDIEKLRMQQLVEAGGAELRADWIKLPHHGSFNASTEAFINLVSPKAAVISTSKKEKPDERLLEILGNSGIEYSDTIEENVIGQW